MLGALAGLGVVLGAGFGRAGRASWVGRGVGRGVWPCWARWLGWAWFQSTKVYSGNTKVDFQSAKVYSRSTKNTLSNYTKYIYKYANIRLKVHKYTCKVQKYTLEVQKYTFQVQKYTLEVHKYTFTVQKYTLEVQMTADGQHFINTVQVRNSCLEHLFIGQLFLSLNAESLHFCECFLKLRNRFEK